MRFLECGTRERGPARKCFVINVTMGKIYFAGL
jgi:hypothetical protein